MTDMAYVRSFRKRPSPCAEMALKVLHGDVPAPSGKEIKDHQVFARDDYALALWSRIRWQWLVANGKAKITLE